MTNRALTEPVTIAKFWRNRAGQAVIVQLKNYEGHALIDVRVYFSAKDGTLKPTAKGIALRAALLPKLLNAIQKAAATATELGILEGGA